MRVTVTSRTSPLTTDCGELKSTAPYNVPVVPPLVLLVTKNAPTILVVAFCVNRALLALLFTDWLDTLPSVSAGLVASVVRCYLRPRTM